MTDSTRVARIPPAETGTDATVASVPAPLPPSTDSTDAPAAPLEPARVEPSVPAPPLQSSARASIADFLAPPTVRAAEDEADEHRPEGRYLLMLSLAALGIVFGDIGTSPLYAMRECLHGPHAVAPLRENVLGVLSLIFWSLTIVIGLKYLLYVLRADNKGEGGILALLALASKATSQNRIRHRFTFVLGLFGASLLYGDGMITPAISVLSAVEGLKVAAPSLGRYVVPITIVILVGLFLIQRRGTGKVGTIFGPITLTWFFALAVLGIYQLVQNPEVLLALSPHYGAAFLAHGGAPGFLVLGAVFLAVTGGEALYADIGHFGKKPIRLTWLWIVMPALVLNYFGQGALLLKDQSAAENPFFRMVPAFALYPMIALSMMATVIASQALISGAFSVTRQATMLGFWPRLRMMHTSDEHIGQIYFPLVNWLLMLAAIGLVLGFRSSSGLAAAYGIAVNMDMVITTLLAFVVARYVWGWSLGVAASLTAALLVVDLAFFGANLSKVADGGWFPLMIGAGLFLVMTTWKRGREILAARFREQMVPLADFFELLRVELPARVPGTGVYMTSNPEGTPPALMTNFMHNRSVHQSVVLLTVITEEVARVAPEERAKVEHLEAGFHRLVARYGFMETPDIPALLATGLIPDYMIEHTSFFLGRETVLATERPGMALWRERIFAFMSRNAQPATAFFGIPPDRVVELGTQIEI
jgi:KUP system potassium uptake protein